MNQDVSLHVISYPCLTDAIRLIVPDHTGNTAVAAEAPVIPDRTISGSHDWLRFGQGIAITNDRRRSMVRSIVYNRATNGSDHRPMWINDCVRRPILDQSWHHGTECMIGRSQSHPVSESRATAHQITCSGLMENIFVVPPVAMPCKQSGHVVSSRTTEPDMV